MKRYIYSFLILTIIFSEIFLLLRYDVSLAQDKQYEETEELLNKINSNYSWIGRNIDQEKFKESLMYANKIVNQFPNSKLNGLIYFIIGRINEHPNYTSEQDNIRYEKAVNAYRKIIQSYPIDKFTTRNIPYCEQGEYYWNEEKPIAPAAQFRIAEIYRKRIKDDDKAIVEFQNLIDLLENNEEYEYDPTNVQGDNLILIAKFKIADMYDEKGLYDKSVALYNEIARQFPNTFFYFDQWISKNTSCEALWKSAENFKRNENYQEAIRNFEEIMSKYPDKSFSKNYGDHNLYSLNALDQIINICTNNIKDDKLAIQELRNLINSISKKQLKIEIQYQIAKIIDEKLNQPEEAIKEYQKVMLLEPYRMIEEDGSEGEFLGYIMTCSGLAKYRIEELNSQKTGAIPKASIFDPPKQYSWDKKICIIDFPRGFALGSPKSIARTSRYIRNEIYARHGYIFKSNDLKRHFMRQNWYYPDPNFNFKMLNDIELRNVKYLEKFEEMVESKKSRDEIRKMLEEFDKN